MVVVVDVFRLVSVFCAISGTVFFGCDASRDSRAGDRGGVNGAGAHGKACELILLSVLEPTESEGSETGS